MDSVIFLSWTIALSCESSSDTGFSLPDTIHTFIHRKVLIKIMNIAICDDEDQERLNIEALVKRYAPELSIVLFSSADELLAAAKTTFFPLIFLDIESNPLS